MEMRKFKQSTDNSDLYVNGSGSLQVIGSRTVVLTTNKGRTPMEFGRPNEVANGYFAMVVEEYKELHLYYSDNQGEIEKFYKRNKRKRSR